MASGYSRVAPRYVQLYLVMPTSMHTNAEYKTIEVCVGTSSNENDSLDHGSPSASQPALLLLLPILIINSYIYGPIISYVRCQSS